jgi:tRNA(Ile2) C34 agmatinyltransferase TiaS
MNIYLHKEKGVNPRLMVCIRCGESTGVALLGTKEYTARCSNCDMTVIGVGRGGGKCPKCEQPARDDIRKIEDHERLPDTEKLCKECDENETQQKKMVAKGGVYFRCTDCKATGAVRADHPLSQDIRESAGVKPPEPISVEFTKEICPLCRGVTEGPRPQGRGG